MNIYKEILKRNIPRLISLYNLDKFSSTYGYGDRAYWAWRTIDFPNGTFQGGTHALSIAFKLGLLETPQFGLEVIKSALTAIARIRDTNGSMAEAYPHENSFCVTALVAFDALSAVENLEGHLANKEKSCFLEIISPLIHFIVKNKEEHAVISNHLSTAAAAIVLWNKLNPSENLQYNHILDTIYKHQSPEGWYKEYEGADPGYQTLTTYYLATIYRHTHEAHLKQSLIKSGEFLKYFVHPDGTIGGLYGSRNTEVYYPGGVALLAKENEDFSQIFKYLQKGILEGSHVLPEHIDIGNFIPLINAYAFAALYHDDTQEDIKNDTPRIPHQNTFEKNFHQAGIYIKSTHKYYAILNYKKGGVLKIFDKKSRTLDIEDGGLFGTLNNNLKFSTQQVDNSIQFDGNQIKTGFYKTIDSYPHPLQFAVLRILSLTIFKSLRMGNFFKRFLVKMLFINQKRIDGEAIRTFHFSEEKVLVKEIVKLPWGSASVQHPGKVKSIQMASSGYYIKQQSLPRQSNFVEFK